MHVKTLILFGSLGATATGGGIYLAIKDSPKPISELLSSEAGLLPITNDLDEKWNAAWKNYRDSHKESGSMTYKNRDRWNINGWETKKSEDVAPKEFKEACKSQSQSKVYSKNDQKYKDVKSWCTRPKKIRELLNWEGKRILLDATGDGEMWGKSWGEYRKHHEKSRQASSITYEDSDVLSVAQWQNKRSQEQVPQEYKDACKTKSEEYINMDQVTNDPVFSKVKRWCTKPK
ncbi:hypothetical protein MHC_03750 [Mycoplasma haemocanis str. Illinois]|uniref:Uncharacterized protein n=1 Tax=Mycoplasma haemocanis (strain Illinois) TaxID=1111676 RepID=H6N7I8_MYCHN|nr:hypothetical protein [Mycoplasma haemocanis]AEW45610.1 hypothetical protein MHC_03750 [Mycoplasma haemocanis str. Illinois]